MCSKNQILYTNISNISYLCLIILLFLFFLQDASGRGTCFNCQQQFPDRATLTSHLLTHRACAQSRTPPHSPDGVSHTATDHQVSSDTDCDVTENLRLAESSTETCDTHSEAVINVMIRDPDQYEDEFDVHGQCSDSGISDEEIIDVENC